MELPFPFSKYAPYEKSFLGFTIYNDNASFIPPTSSINIFVDKSQPVDNKQLSATSPDHDRTFSSFTDINIHWQTVDHKQLSTTSPDHDRTFASITDINLYRQPVLPPTISLVIIPIIQLIFVSTGMFIQLRTLQMLRRETSVNNMMMVTQAKIHIIFWPIWAIAVTLTESIYPLANLITPYSCHLLKFYVYFSLFSFILYSFYASLLRYLFCIYTTRVTQFGKEKLIQILYWMFYIHTFLWTIFTHATSLNMDHLPVINSCFGVHHNVFLMESSAISMLKRHFCFLATDRGILNIH